MKSQAPSNKLQTDLKSPYSMTKRQDRFGISNFGYCDLEFMLLPYSKTAGHLYRQSRHGRSCPAIERYSLIEEIACQSKDVGQILLII